MTRDWLALDPLDASVLLATLGTRQLGRRLEVHRRLGSTNDRMRELWRAGAAPGTVVIAEEQSAGRGRRGRRWRSAPGLGLWMSVLLELGDVAPGLLMLSTALGVRRGIVAAGGPALDVKWPNDLGIGGRKVCGILVEVAGDGLGVLGVGINVHHAAADFPAELRGRASSIDAAGGRTMARNVVARRVLEALEEVGDTLRAGETERLLAAWRAACPHLGRRVRLSTPAGAFEGTALDVDPEGALLVRETGGRTRRVLAGGLTVVEGGGRPASPARSARLGP